jgi:formylglycine-generating enzyme
MELHNPKIERMLILGLLLGLGGCAQNKETAPAVIPEGMVWIPGGEFTMGSNASYALRNEGPPHTVVVRSFLMDAHPVTNAQFAAFVAATGYITMAERPVDWEEMRAIAAGHASPSRGGTCTGFARIRSHLRSGEPA